MAEPIKWEPDQQMLPALLAGSEAITYKALKLGDRAWAVAGLRLAGITVEAIAAQLKCTARQVNDVQASPAGVLARFYMTEVDAFEDTLRMLQGDNARLERERAEAVESSERYRTQLGRMIDSYITGETGPSFPKCGHPKTKYNTYTAPKTGKTSCRMCHCEAQAAYRARINAIAEGQDMDYGEASEFITARLQDITGRRAQDSGAVGSRRAEAQP